MVFSVVRAGSEATQGCNGNPALAKTGLSQLVFKLLRGSDVHIPTLRGS
jgi:hypothetical protein